MYLHTFYQSQFKFTFGFGYNVPIFEKIAEQFLPCHDLCFTKNLCCCIIFEINDVMSKEKCSVNIKSIAALEITNFTNVYKRNTF